MLKTHLSLLWSLQNLLRSRKLLVRRGWMRWWRQSFPSHTRAYSISCISAVFGDVYTDALAVTLSHSCVQRINLLSQIPSGTKSGFFTNRLASAREAGFGCWRTKSTFVRNPYQNQQLEDRKIRVPLPSASRSSLPNPRHANEWSEVGGG